MKVLNEVVRQDDDGNPMPIGVYSLGKITPAQHNAALLGKFEKTRLPDTDLSKARESQRFVKTRLRSVQLTDGTPVGEVVGNMWVPASLDADYEGEYCVEILWRDRKMLPLAREADLVIGTDGTVTLRGEGA